MSSILFYSPLVVQALFVTTGDPLDKKTKKTLKVRAKVKRRSAGTATRTAARSLSWGL